MSSAYSSSPFTSVEAEELRAQAHDGNLELNGNLESTLLSPYNPSHTLSNSASPSHNFSSTPGESVSEYSEYQPSEFIDEDPFFGVDFDAGVNRVDSLSSTLLGSVAYPPAQFNQHPEPSSHEEANHLPQPPSASTYPLSPIHTSIPNTPSPRIETNDPNGRIVTPQELSNNSHTSQQHHYSLAPAAPSTLQLTPDHSGSSHTSAEGVEPSTMSHFQDNPNVTVSHWGTDQSQGPMQAEPQPTRKRSAGQSDDEGQRTSGARTGQAGLDPNSRKEIASIEMSSLKEQQERRRIDTRNAEVEEWMSGSDGDDEQPSRSYFNLNGQDWTSPQDLPPAPRNDPTEGEDIAEVSDTASVRENKLIEGHVYYNPKAAPPTDADMALMSQPLQWNDAPSLAWITKTKFQPGTANEAMTRWNGQADAFSIVSRQATWGTRRRSETNLADYESVVDGSIFKKLAISKPREGNRDRQSSLFDQGLDRLDRLASLVRNRSDGKIKRVRSTQNIPKDAQGQAHPRHNSQGSLAPPARTSSSGRRQSPNINTALAAMSGPLAAVGTTHARSGSVSATATSPKGPGHLGFARSAINRVRSKSELTSHESAVHKGLFGLLRAQGGPPAPMPMVSSPPIEAEVKPTHQELLDQDEDEDEEDEQGDEDNLKTESDDQAEPIMPNYEGFKDHVRRLNPDMDLSRYSWLVSRIAHQQEVRYKHLLELRVRHSQATVNHTCAAGLHCMAAGGRATVFDAKGKPRESDLGSAGLQLVTDFSDDSNPGEGAITDETFPKGVPMPPTRNLPAEFECQLCFRVKKFQKPSDWTKHVHEDVQPFTCTYDKCKEPKSFKRKADWVRHENERHRHLEWWICQMDDCRHPCYRKDNFLQHLVREHKLPEPKQKTKAAIKKSTSTEPAWRMVEQCHHETQKKPQDEPCKFCGKPFNTWKKLTVHLAKHMEYISLPVLKLVDKRQVDANTIISPVEQNLTPITPIGPARKFESSSPFNMNNISPHLPTGPQFPSGFEHPTFFPTTGPSSAYGMQVPQEVTYDQNTMYANSFGPQHFEQPRTFGSLDSGNVGNMAQARPLGSMDSGFSNTRGSQSRPFGSLDSSFHPTMPGPNFHMQQPGYPMPQNFVSEAPAVSGYQARNMLGISSADFEYDSMDANPAQSFAQPPMSRGPANAPSYGTTRQNNMPYYEGQNQ